jgi:hypothetical protein
METLTPVFNLVGAIVLAGGGLSLVVYQVFKHLAARWLDAKFEQRLQSLRHEHDQELEGLRFKIAALLDRAVKLHQREFEVLPEAWSKLNDAYWYVKGFVSALQSYPDIDRMNPAHQKEFIDSSPLQGWQKEELAKEKNKTDFYRKQIFWHKLDEAQRKSRDASIFLVKNGIFIQEQIREKLTKMSDLIWNALVEHQINEEHDMRPRERKSVGRLNDEGEPLMKALEADIHRRLWPDDKAPITKRAG